MWGFKAIGNTRTVDAHACRLRKKLALAGAPHLIANVRGVGYRLSAGPVVVEREAVDVALSRNGRAAWRADSKADTTAQAGEPQPSGCAPSKETAPAESCQPGIPGPAGEGRRRGVPRVRQEAGRSSAPGVSVARRMRPP